MKILHFIPVDEEGMHDRSYCPCNPVPVPSCCHDFDGEIALEHFPFGLETKDYVVLEE